MSQPVVCVFPGQGAQKRGMAKDFYQHLSVSRAVFDEASQALSLDMAALCFEDDPRLGLTEFTQPAILTAEIAMLRGVQEEHGFAPTHFGGHSLGEYTALVAAGALPLADAVRVVRERGRRMQDAVPAGEGAMVAIIGEVDHEVLEGALEGKQVDLANLNSAQQAVISGATEDVRQVVESLTTESGFADARFVELKVSAPFHSRMMAPIVEGFRAVLAAAPWQAQAARVVVSNTTGGFHHGDLDELIDLLARQITSSVRWADNMQTLLALEPARVVEIGPRKVLRGFFQSVGVSVTPVFNRVSARRGLGSAG